MRNLLQAINNLGTTVDNKDDLVDLDSDRLIKIAKETMGLDDFGDMHWLSGFDRTIQSLRTKSLTGLARLYYKHFFLLELQNRLSIVEFVNKNPEVSGSKIDAPILILGNPRTGTSILYEMLNEDQNLRAPLGWEVIFPAGFPGEAYIDRKAIARSTLDLAMEIEPAMKCIHEVSWRLPTERFMNMLFDQHSVLDRGVARSFCIWLKRTLQILQSQTDKKTWVVKNPLFVFLLEDLLVEFPDARIIYMHRDPACSMASLFGFLEKVKAMDFGYSLCGWKSELDFWKKGYEAALSARKGLKNAIVDVQFQDLMNEPVQEIQRIYSHLGLELNESILNKVGGYLKVKPRHRYGKHRYNLDGFGFDPCSIREQFRRYIEFYSVPVESF